MRNNDVISTILTIAGLVGIGYGLCAHTKLAKVSKRLDLIFPRISSRKLLRRRSRPKLNEQLGRQLRRQLTRLRKIFTSRFSRQLMQSMTTSRVKYSRKQQSLLQRSTLIEYAEMLKRLLRKLLSRSSTIISMIFSRTSMKLSQTPLRFIAPSGKL